MSYEKIGDALGRSAWVDSSWRALPGQLTPDGRPALFRSSPHALMAMRMLYLEQVEQAGDISLEERSLRYRHGWARFVQNCHDMRAVVEMLEMGDTAGAAARWNALDQVEANRAFRIVLGEREFAGARTLATAAWRHFGLTRSPVARDQRDRALRPADHDGAWSRSPGGVCRGCGTPTISHAQRKTLHSALKDAQFGFDTTKTYVQHHGKIGTLWEQLTIAARGVAEHVVPWSQGGPTSVANLTNACAGCNYARSDISLDEAGIAAYDQPAVEVEAGRDTTLRPSSS